MQEHKCRALITSHCLSRRHGFCAEQFVIELHVLINHPLGSKPITGSLECAVCVRTAEVALLAETSYEIRKAGCVIGTKVKCGVSPSLAEWSNVIGNDGAAGKGSFERCHPKGFVA